MLVLPHAAEINDPDKAIAILANALNIRDPAPVDINWPDDLNGRLSTIQVWLEAQVDALMI